MKKFDLELKKGLRVLAVGPVTSGPFLFYYSNFVAVQNELASILTDTQAERKLKDFPDMPVTVYHLEGSTTPQPAILKNRKGLATEEVKGINEVIDLIFIASGAKVSEADLLKQI